MIDVRWLPSSIISGIITGATSLSFFRKFFLMDIQHIEQITTVQSTNGEKEHHISFISKYIFSQDHKTISKHFLIKGMTWAIIGGLFSVLFRLQLGYPERSFPILETIFGKWGAGGRIDPGVYYSLVTIHGTVMIFFVLTAGLSGTFANLLIPLQVGARDMASPFLNMLSYWFFFMASIVMLTSFFLPDGASDVGWTFYPPLSAVKESAPGA